MYTKARECAGGGRTLIKTNMSRYYQGLSNKNMKKCLTCVSKTNILAVGV